MSAATALLGVLILSSPLASPPPAVEGCFPGAGGARLFRRKVGSGPKVVVFLHGGPGANYRGSGEFIEPLAAAGHSVVLYDQRGSGRSDVETIPALLTAAHHVRDLEALRPGWSGSPCPTLVVEGQQSKVPLDATREWAVVMPGARLLLVPEAGHEAFVDQPEAFLAAVRPSLRGRFPRAAEVVPGPDAH